jgi:hypothetical protein
VTTSVGDLLLDLLEDPLKELSSSFCPGEPQKEDWSRPCCRGDPNGKGEKGETLGLEEESLRGSDIAVTDYCQTILKTDHLSLVTEPLPVLYMNHHLSQCD